MSQDLVLAGLAAVAGVLLLAGLVQVLRVPPRRRPRRLRRRLSRAPSRPLRAEPRQESAVRPSPPRASRTFTPRSKPAAPEAPSPSTSATPADLKLPTAGTPTEAPPPDIPPVAAPPAEPMAAPVVPDQAETAPPTLASRDAGLPLDQCRGLYEARLYQELIATAEPELQRALSGASESAPRAQDVAALWNLLALSRRALGDDEGARSALEEALHAAPQADRASYQREMATLVTNVSRRLRTHAEQVPEGSGEERIGALRQAIQWLQQGLGEVPGDGELSSALNRTRWGLWTAYGQTVDALIERQEFHRARRLIHEALVDEELPADRRESFEEALSATFTGEIEQLIGSAIRTTEDGREREALAFLERAEAVLSATPAEMIFPKHREEMSRRFWLGYTKVGMEWVEAGEHEEAVEPLFHALKMEGIDPERQQETRETLLRALEGVAESRAAAITRLVYDGQRDAAGEKAEHLKSLIRDSLERGLSQQELAPAISTARRIVEWLERGSPER